MAIRKTGGLGRGLDALIPSKKKENDVSKSSDKAASVSSAEINKKADNESAESKDGPANQPKDPNDIDLEAIDKILASIGSDSSNNSEEEPEVINGITPADKNSPADGRHVDSMENNQGKASSSAISSPPVTAVKIDSDEEGADQSRVIYAKISSVEPNREQPRKNFDEDALLELADSIRQFGVIQPLLVSKEDGYYKIIAGERRWRAAKLAGLKEVPVIVKELTKRESVEISLIENIQRENLNPIEEAIAYKRLMEEFSLKQEEIAERVSKSRTAITNSMRLLKLDEKVQQMVNDDMISAGHARALLSLPTGELQAKIAMKIYDEKLSVRETEKLVKKVLEPPVEKVPPFRDTSEDAIFENLENRMKGLLGTKVSIVRKKNNKGIIEIEYYSNDELDRIIELLGTVSEAK